MHSTKINGLDVFLPDWPSSSTSIHNTLQKDDLGSWSRFLHSGRLTNELVLDLFANSETTTGGSTVCVGIVDDDNLAVAAMSSLSLPFGSGALCADGITLLNSRMTNEYREMIGKRDSTLGPHTLHPVIIRDADETLCGGVSGGGFQRNAVAAIILTRLIGHKSISDWVNEPRMYWARDVLITEEEADSQLSEFCKRAKKVETWRPMGDARFAVSRGELLDYAIADTRFKGEY